MTTHCPNCGLAHDDSVLTCDCGTDLVAHRQQRHTAIKKNEFLATAATVFWLLAGLSAISGLIYVVWLATHEAIWQALAALIATAISAYIYIIAATAITLLIKVSTDLDAIRQTHGPTRTGREQT